MRFRSPILPFVVGFVVILLFAGRACAQIPSGSETAVREQVPTAVPSPPSLNGEIRRPSKPNSKPLLIRPEFLPGNTYRFLTRTKLSSRAGEAFIEQQARFDAGVRVDGKNGVLIKARTERLDVQLQSTGRTLVYNSLKPEDQSTLMGRHFQTALYRSVDFTLNQDLSVASANEGGRTISESPLPGMPRFGPDELRQLMVTIPQGFAARPVHPGESWIIQGDRSVGEVGILNFHVTYRLVGPVNFEDNHCLSIEFSGQLSGDVPLTGTDGRHGEGLIGLQGNSIRGRILFDPLDKMLRFSEQSIDLLLSVPGPEGTDPQQIPVQQTTTIRLLHVVATP